MATSMRTPAHRHGVDLSPGSLLIDRSAPMPTSECRSSWPWWDRSRSEPPGRFMPMIPPGGLSARSQPLFWGRIEEYRWHHRQGGCRAQGRFLWRRLP